MVRNLSGPGTNQSQFHVRLLSVPEHLYSLECVHRGRPARQSRLAEWFRFPSTLRVTGRACRVDKRNSVCGRQCKLHDPTDRHEWHCDHLCWAAVDLGLEQRYRDERALPESDRGRIGSYGESLCRRSSGNPKNQHERCCEPLRGPTLSLGLCELYKPACRIVRMDPGHHL